jgi:3-oxoacyl-[acyl-carrier protein] reductase
MAAMPRSMLLLRPTMLRLATSRHQRHQLQQRALRLSLPRAAISTNPMFDLSGRTALVTGGARDIGGACAIELARAGADVVINFNSSAAAAEETVAAIKMFGRRACAVQANVFEQTGREELVGAAQAFFGGEGKQICDILVNNAGGLNLRGELCDDVMTEELMLDNLQMNFVSTAMMCKAVIPGMKEREWGRIINMGSIAGNNGGSGTTTPHCTWIEY